MEGGLRESFDPSMFPAGDAPEISHVKDALGGPFFTQNYYMTILASLPEKERKWMQGCECHEQECIQYAAKGMTYKCPNNRKSCRGPEIRERLDSSKADWISAQASLFVPKEKDPDGSVFAGIQTGCSTLLAQVSVKRLHVYRLPWRLWEARGEVIAGELYEVYLDDQRNGRFIHRVTAWWMDGESQLSVECLNHAVHRRGIGPVLDLELVALESAKLDGACVEAMHGELSRVCVNSTGSSYKYRAATVRMKQNLDDYGPFCRRHGYSAFSKKWLRYKSVLARGARKVKKIIPTRIKDAKFFEVVYRYGVSAMSDWRDLARFLKVPRNRRAVAITDSEKLKKDFIQSVIRPNNLYSIVDREQAAAMRAQAERGDDGAIVPYGSEYVAFEVIDQNPAGRVNAVQTRISDGGSYQRWHRFLMPLHSFRSGQQVQTHTSWRMRALSVASQTSEPV